jgi:ubiquitin-protein ligase
MHDIVKNRTPRFESILVFIPTMSACINTGAVFVRNYLSREWRVECKQTKWTLMPAETNINNVKILYQFDEETHVDKFRGLQLIFEVRINEEHPYKPPSIKVLTPNGRMNLYDLICIHGLTAWHPESWNIITSFQHIVNAFVGAFLDIEKTGHFAGQMESTDAVILEYAKNSAGWNAASFPELVEQYQEQCLDYAKYLEMAAISAALAADAGAGAVDADTDVISGCGAGAGATEDSDSEYEFEYDSE